jgi:hypothetical protein
VLVGGVGDFNGRNTRGARVSVARPERRGRHGHLRDAAVPTRVMHTVSTQEVVRCFGWQEAVRYSYWCS